MKKLFVILFMVLSLVMAGSNAMACEGNECEGGDSTVSGYYFAQPMDYDKSFSKVGNDYGFAEGIYGVGGEMNTFANAEGCSREWVWTGWFRGHWEYTPNEAFQEGSILATSEAKAWSWAKDYGLTSKAGAGIKAEDGFVIISGFVKGKGGEPEFISSRVIYGADFYQKNAANEVGYSAGDVFAFNQSGLNFEASEYWKEGTFLGFHLNGADYTPDVITKGKSEVTIDPSGNYRSIAAHTENMSYMESLPNDMTMHYANVYGNGYVGGVISNGAAFAGGNVNFMYNGYTEGQGQAQLDAVVKTYGQGTTAYVSGSSSAVANGGNTPN